VCDPIWQVTLRSSVMDFPLRAILGFNFNFSGVAFSALALLTGRQEGHPTCKKFCHNSVNGSP